MQTLAEQALAQTHADLRRRRCASIEAIIAAIDAKLTEQINVIMHHEDFQQLESAWRGLHHLVNNTETDEMLKIRVLNISKKELGRTLKKFQGTAWDQSPIFKKLYEEEYGQFGGEPFGCLVGDYYFDHSPQDVELLGDIAQVAAAAHAPFIAAAAPTVMQMESWQELANPRDLTKIFQTPEYAAWRSLRESEDSRYLGLCMPRFLARLPYGAKTDPVEEFDFEEDTEGADSSKYCLGQLGLRDGDQHHPRLQAVRLVHAHPRHRERRRGRRPAGAHLPDRRRRRGHEVPDRDRDQRPARGGAGEERLHAADPPKNTDFAAFIGAQSLQKPQEYDDPGRDGERQPRGAAALSVRQLPLRALPEMHGARQDRQHHDQGAAAELAADLAQPVCRRLARHLARRTGRRRIRWPKAGSRSRRTRRTPATTAPSSSSSRTTSLRA